MKKFPKECGSSFFSWGEVQKQSFGLTVDGDLSQILIYVYKKCCLVGLPVQSESHFDKIVSSSITEFEFECR